MESRAVRVRKRKRLRLRFDRELFEQPSREQFVILHPAVMASRGIDDDFNRNAAVALCVVTEAFTNSREKAMT